MAWSFPAEVIGVLRQHPGYSICVKGRPGSCKTAFVLTLLKHLSPDHKAFYVSARVNPDKLYCCFPWVKSYLEPSSIIDGIACKAESDSSAFELLKYRTNLGLVQSIYQKTSTLHDPIICVDSWTEIMKVASGSSEDVFDMFCDLCLQRGARMILVEETSSQTDLDHLVDGLIDMGTLEHGGEVHRYLQIRKLTGTSHDLRKQLVDVNGDGLVVTGRINGSDIPSKGDSPNKPHGVGGPG